MSAANDNTRPGRRRFLKGVVAIGGTTVLVAAAREALTPDEAVPNAATPDQAVERDRSYHLTRHIESYYEKARF